MGLSKGTTRTTANELESGATDKSQKPDEPGTREDLAQVFLSVAVFIGVLTSLIFGTLHGLSNNPWQSTEPSHQPKLRPKSFYDGDGAVAYDYDVVPDIIHLVRNNQPNLTLLDVVFYRSMYLNHRPSTIMLHCNPCGFTGPFVNWTEGINFTFKPYIFPSHIFGNKVQLNIHITDVARMHILRRYGGIYLDRDVFVIQSLRRFLRYETTLSCQPKSDMTNNIMVFHKNSRFLKLYIELHRQYNDSLWNYHATVLPTKLLARKRKHLVNCMDYGLEAALDMLGAVFEPHAYPNWRDAFAVHPYVNYRGESPHDALHNAPFNETNIRDVDNAMGQMARSVLFGTSDFVGPDAPVLSVAELAARKDRGEDLTKRTPGNARPFYRK